MDSRLLGIGLGLSAWVWAVLGLIAGDGGRPLLVRLTVTALNVTVGTLFLVRRSASRGPGARQILAALPSMIVAAAALRFAPDEWTGVSQLLFCAGGAFAVLALATLGRSFALLPAVRGVVTTGPFRVVRHPVYAGELAMIVATGLARGPWWAAALGAVSTLLLVPRIRAEEALLGTTVEYRAYAAAVPDRLVPHVW